MTRPIFARGMGTSPAGPPGKDGTDGTDGKDGQPGVNAVENDEAVATYVADPDSETGRAVLATVATAVAPRPLTAGSNVRAAGAFQGGPPTSTPQTSRIPHAVGYQGRGVVLEYLNSSTQPVTISAAVESAAGALLPVLFAGLPSVTVAAGASISSDLASVAFNKGATLWSRTYVTGTWQPNHAHYDGGGARGSKSASNLTTAGSGPVTDNGSSYMFGPVNVLMIPGQPGAVLCAAAVGDSIDSGTGDNANGGLSSAGNPDGGWLDRVVSGKGGLQHLGLPGENLYAFLDFTADRDFRLSQLATATDAFEGYGRNDLNAQRTADQLMADKVRLWKLIRSNGAQRVWARTLTPKSTSTDGWSTVANQAIDPAGGNPVRNAVNTWLRAGAPLDATGTTAVTPGTSGAIVARHPLHPLTGILDLAAAVEAGTPGLWKAGMSGDGQHPNGTGYAAMAAVVDPDALG